MCVWVCIFVYLCVTSFGLLRLFTALPVWPERKQRARPRRLESALHAAVCTCLPTREQKGCSWAFSEQPQLGSNRSPASGSQESSSSHSATHFSAKGETEPSFRIAVPFTGQEELTGWESLLCATLFTCLISF